MVGAVSTAIKRRWNITPFLLISAIKIGCECVHKRTPISLPRGNGVVDELFPTLEKASPGLAAANGICHAYLAPLMRRLVLLARFGPVVGFGERARWLPPGTSTRPNRRRPGPNVVLVHGFWDTGAIFDPLVEILEKQGCRCFAPSFRPNDFRFGVHAQAIQLAAAVDARFGKDAPVVFVCFSNGGLVSRDYVENMGGRRRTRAMFFICTAHRGTLWAALSPRRGVREFAPGSAFLHALDAKTSARWPRSPCTRTGRHSIWSIIPASKYPLAL